MADAPDDWTAIATPPGVPWSGRARYAAAASFYNRGLIGADVLEVYRILSRLDGEDPALRLSDFDNGRKWLAVLEKHRRTRGTPDHSD